MKKSRLEHLWQKFDIYIYVYLGYCTDDCAETNDCTSTPTNLILLIYLFIIKFSVVCFCRTIFHTYSYSFLVSVTSLALAFIWCWQKAMRHQYCIRFCIAIAYCSACSYVRTPFHIHTEEMSELKELKRIKLIWNVSSTSAFWHKILLCRMVWSIEKLRSSHFGRLEEMNALIN